MSRSQSYDPLVNSKNLKKSDGEAADIDFGGSDSDNDSMMREYKRHYNSNKNQPCSTYKELTGD